MREKQPPESLLPLYRGVGRRGVRSGLLQFEGASSLATPSSNPALLFDKFLDTWAVDRRVGLRLTGTEKERFLQDLLGWYKERTADLQRLLDRQLERQKALVQSLGGHLVVATTEWRLVSGLGNGHPLETGLVWHPTLGVPYLPGSTVKGMVRAWAEDPEERGGWGALDSTQVPRLFGDLNEQGAGLLCFFDALPVKVPDLQLDIMNPHYGEYYQNRSSTPPADYLSPNPVKFLAVAPGQEFRFAVALRPGTRFVIPDASDVLELGLRLLEEALTEIGLGAKTAAGYGAFQHVKRL